MGCGLCRIVRPVAGVGTIATSKPRKQDLRLRLINGGSMRRLSKPACGNGCGFGYLLPLPCLYI